MTLTRGACCVVQVPGSINQHLRSYQKQGVQFLFNRYAAGMCLPPSTQQEASEADAASSQPGMHAIPTLLPTCRLKGSQHQHQGSSETGTGQTQVEDLSILPQLHLLGLFAMQASAPAIHWPDRVPCGCVVAIPAVVVLLQAVAVFCVTTWGWARLCRQVTLVYCLAAAGG